MSFTPLSARQAQVRIGSYAFTAKKWTVAAKIDALDVTNFEGAGFGQYIGGVYDADITIEAEWDSSSDPFANPPNIVIGTVLTAIKLFTSTTSSPFWLFNSALVVDTTMSAEVRGTLAITCTLKSSGTFTYP